MDENEKVLGKFFTCGELFFVLDEQKIVKTR